MSNYTKTVNFAAKDALTTGDANKIVKGTEIDTEYNNIATAVATKFDTVSNVPAANVSAGTFSTGTFSFDASSVLRVGGASPSVSWRVYSSSVSTGTGHPAFVGDRQNFADSSCFFCDDSTVGTGSRNLIVFGLNNNGYAAISTTFTAILYGTPSDYRLKTNVMPLTGSATKIKTLKPYSYNWVKFPEIQGQGFLAHELAEVVPQAVTGEKDAVNGDGSVKSQQVDLSYVIPLLTSALQEALARIETLEAK